MPPTGALPPNANPRLEGRQTLVNIGYSSEGFNLLAARHELWTACPDDKIVIVDVEKEL